MYEKVKNFGDNIFFSSRFNFIFGVIGSIVAFILIKNCFVEYIFKDYHEKYYEMLENEATRIFESHDFTSEYEYDLTYNNKTKKLEVTLYTEDHAEEVMLTIKNYNTPNETCSIKRDIPSREISTKLQNILIVFISIVAGLLFEILLCCIYGIILFILFICHYLFTQANNKSQN